MIFEYVRVLFYADDMKLFLPVESFQDFTKIQSDLNKQSELCEINSLFLHVDKCKTITFSRTRYFVELSYMLGGTVHYKRSGGHHRRKKISEHIEVIVGKAFAILGFFRRRSFEFRDPYTLRSLYT
jgi:hypothetical protein